MLGKGQLSKIGAEGFCLPYSGIYLTAFKEKCPWLPRVPRSRHPSVDTGSASISLALNCCGRLSETRCLSYTLVLSVSLPPYQKVRNVVLSSLRGHIRATLGACVARDHAWGGVTLPAARCRQVATRLHPKFQLPCRAGLQAFCKFRDIRLCTARG